MKFVVDKTFGILGKREYVIYTNLDPSPTVNFSEAVKLYANKDGDYTFIGEGLDISIPVEILEGKYLSLTAFVGNKKYPLPPIRLAEYDLITIPQVKALAEENESLKNEMVGLRASLQITL